MKSVSTELCARVELALTSDTPVVFSGSELQTIFASDSVDVTELDATATAQPLPSLPPVVFNVTGIPDEWVQAVRIAADVLDMASLLPLPSVKVSPPPEWGVGANGKLSAEGWANTVALAQKLRTLLPAPPA